MRIIPNPSIMYAFYQIHNKLVSTQPSPVTMRNKLAELKPTCSETTPKVKKAIQLPDQIFISSGRHEEQMAIGDRVYESLSEPLRFENICTLQASDCLNDRITVTVTMGDTEHPTRPEHPCRPPYHPDKPHHPDRPHHPDKPHHHGRDRFETGHHHQSETGHYTGIYDKCGKIPQDKPPHRPHNDQGCGNPGTTVTLTFIKSLGLSSTYTSENSLTINNEKVLLNSQGEALLVMSDDTLRWGKLKPEILEQIRQQNEQDDFPKESGEENGNED